jgi:hypothetical protein
MSLEAQKKKEQGKKCRKRKIDILFQILFLDPFTSNNYILFISHSFFTISKTTYVLFQDLWNSFKVKRQKNNSWVKIF